MLKWKIAAVLGLALGAAGVTWGYAQQSRAPGFYELRVYTALPGKRDALAERFASRTAAIYARHGITNVGYWIPQESDPELGISAENTFIYIRGYPSKQERDKRLTAAHDDPAFGEGAHPRLWAAWSLSGDPGGLPQQPPATARSADAP